MSYQVTCRSSLWSSPSWGPVYLFFHLLGMLWPQGLHGSLLRPSSISGHLCSNYHSPRIMFFHGACHYMTTPSSLFTAYSPQWTVSSLKAGTLIGSLLWSVPRTVGLNKDCFSKQSNDLESNPWWKGKMVKQLITNGVGRIPSKSSEIPLYVPVSVNQCIEHFPIAPAGRKVGAFDSCVTSCYFLSPQE